MRMVPVPLESVPNIRYGKRKVDRAIESFINSEYEAVRLDYTHTEYVSTASLQSVYTRALRRNHYDNVRCIVRENNAYLIKLKDPVLWSPESED